MVTVSRFSLREKGPITHELRMRATPLAPGGEDDVVGGEEPPPTPLLVSYSCESAAAPPGAESLYVGSGITFSGSGGHDGGGHILGTPPDSKIDLVLADADALAVANNNFTCSFYCKKSSVGGVYVEFFGSFGTAAHGSGFLGSLEAWSGHNTIYFVGWGVSFLYFVPMTPEQAAMFDDWVLVGLHGQKSTGRIALTFNDTLVHEGTSPTWQGATYTAVDADRKHFEISTWNFNDPLDDIAIHANYSTYYGAS